MNDVQIIFPKGKETIAERLREAIGRAGYDVSAGEGVDTGAWPVAGDASAVLILWDRATMAHPGLQAVAADARQAGRALDISTDGITPRGFRDESRLIQLSGWRGEPFHPGWKRILAELQRLYGGERKPAPPAPAASRQAPDAPASDASSRPKDGRGLSGKVILAVLALVLVAALVGFWLMSKHSSPAEPVRQPIAPAVTTSRPAEALPEQTRTAPSAATVETPSAAAPAAGGETQSNAAANPIPPQSEQPPVSLASPTKPAKSVKARHEEKRKAVHYTKYAKTMRLFCERSGRDTPQCRLFMRQTRGAKP